MTPAIADPFSGSEYDYIRQHEAFVDIFARREDGRHLRILAAPTSTAYGRVALLGLYEDGKWLTGQANDGLSHPVLGRTLSEDADSIDLTLGVYAGTYIPEYHMEAEILADAVRLRRRKRFGERWQKETWARGEGDVWTIRLARAEE